MFQHAKIRMLGQGTLEAPTHRTTLGLRLEVPGWISEILKFLWPNSNSKLDYFLIQITYFLECFNDPKSKKKIDYFWYPPGNDHIFPLPASTFESMFFRLFPFGGIWTRSQEGTLPNANIAPGTEPSQKETHLPIPVLVRSVSFREGTCIDDDIWYTKHSRHWF